MADDALSAEEVALLLGRPLADSGDAAPFPSELAEPLTALHQQAAREFSIALAGLVRRAAHVRLAAIEHAEQGASLPTTACRYPRQIRSGELSRPWQLELAGDVLSPIIDCLLGSDGASCVPLGRPPTEIECRLLDRVVRPFVAALEQAWQAHAPLTLQLADDTATPCLETSGNPALLVRFTVEVAAARGSLHLVFPVADIAATLAHCAQPAEARQDTRGENSEVELIACLHESALAADELAQLATGDIIATDHPADQPILVAYQGKPHFAAKLGALHGKKALRLDAPTADTDFAPRSTAPDTPPG